MSDALVRFRPKKRYLEATRLDKTLAYCVRYLPTMLTNRLRLLIHNQLLNFYGQFFFLVAKLHMLTVKNTLQIGNGY